MADWFRSWHGAPTDNKWLSVARKAGVAPGVVSAVAWALMDHASQSENRGDVSRFDVDTYAAFSGFSEAVIAAVILAMTDKGMIVDGRLASWERRQPTREDSSTDRVKAWREKRKSPVAEAHSEVECNATKRSETHCNAPDTETDTETEIIRFPSVPVAARQAREQTVKMVSSKAFPATGSIAFVEPWVSIAKRCRPGVDVDVMAEKFRRWCPTKGVDLGASNIAERFASFCRTDAKTSAKSA